MSEVQDQPIAGTSFKRPEPNRAYHIFSLAGAQQSGKTKFACSAPGPIAYQSCDFSTDGVIDEAISEGKEIFVAEYRAPVDLTADEMFRDAKAAANEEEVKQRAFKLADAQAKRITDAVWRPLVSDFRTVVADPGIRTIVWDTADAINDILRLAYYGKIERNSQLGNGLLNAELKDLVKLVVESKKNFIMLHQLADEYQDGGDGKSIRTGRQKRRGNANVDYLVQSFAQSTYVPPPVGNPKEDPGRWLMTIQKARLNPRANNRVLENADWATLMSVLMPNVPMEAWL